MSVRRTHLRTLVGLVLLVALVGFATAEDRHAPDQGPISGVVYPPKSSPLIFSHGLHVGKLAVACEDCHDKVRTSASALDNNLPRESHCSSCHAIDRSKTDRQPVAGQPPSQCAACHRGFRSQSGFVARAQTPIPNLKFSHQAHLARGTTCAACHGAGGEQAQGQESMNAWLPTMRACLGCHDGKKASESCTACHLSRAGGRVKTDFAWLGSLSPNGSLRGAAHDMKFRTSHKYAAQNDPEFCESCHTKKDCVDCHSGVVKPMDFHAGDYISMHSIDARRNSPDCSGCHRIQTFCQGCHTRMGVAADGKGSAFDGPAGINFHPPGWTSTSLTGAPGPASHAFEAQRNIKQCASCHRETFCTRCHSNQASSPLRVNPHPRDWSTSRRCSALLKRNRRMCLRCHTEAEPLRCGN